MPKFLVEFTTRLGCDCHGLTAELSDVCAHQLQNMIVWGLSLGSRIPCMCRVLMMNQDLKALLGTLFGHCFTFKSNEDSAREK